MIKKRKDMASDPSTGAVFKKGGIMKKFALLTGALSVLMLLFIYCSEVSYDNILDPEGSNYMPGFDKPEDKDAASADDDGNGIANVFDTNSVWYKDLKPPVIKLALGTETVTFAQGNLTEYTRWTTIATAQVTATDNRDLDINSRITYYTDIPATIPPGSFKIYYVAKDAAGNADTVSRNVTITEVEIPDTDPPTITLKGLPTIAISVGDAFNDPGVNVSDLRDPNPVVTKVPNTINTSVTDTIVITYTATDKAGNSAFVTRTLMIQDAGPGVIKPTLTLVGGDTVMARGGRFIEPGFSAQDNTGPIAVTDSVKPIINLDDPITEPGLYTITYIAKNTAGTVFDYRRIFVYDPSGCPGEEIEPPVISLTDGANVTLSVGQTWNDRWSATSPSFVQYYKYPVSGTVDTSKPGTYELTYRVIDECNNVVERTRTVTVQ